MKSHPKLISWCQAIHHHQWLGGPGGEVSLGTKPVEAHAEPAVRHQMLRGGNAGSGQVLTTPRALAASLDYLSKRVGLKMHIMAPNPICS